ncbi:unnamed protein product [Moneuplotes crassus]|uniref:Uncharacterized protein n=1 Tax=Euplotes crassus TaxID=5936 RepID=A0AAD1XZC5_EUPCR|nr:unnamed protein product [Moneuplotes crassus]
MLTCELDPDKQTEKNTSGSSLYIKSEGKSYLEETQSPAEQKIYHLYTKMTVFLHDHEEGCSISV